METFDTDTPPYPSRNGRWPPLLRPALTRPAWHSDSSDPPPFIAPCPDYAHINFARNHALESGPTQLLYADSDQAYLSPPSTSSKPTVFLPTVSTLYSTHLAGVLDSPPVMRREDLAVQKPLTPPPTMPHPTLSLPDADVPDDHDIEDSDKVSRSSSPPSLRFGLPLSPLSPSWDPPRALSIAPPPDFPEGEPPNALFFCNATAPHVLDYAPSRCSPSEPSSLLEVDVDSLLTPIDIPCHELATSESDPEPPSSSTSGCSFASLTDYDELPPPSSPLISGLDLPDLEEDVLPKIVPSSPSRRSCSCLPESDVEMEGECDGVNALPGQQLLSLPGAETDDELIPSVPTRSFPIMPTQPLLFIDDPRDVPLPRSPSPEDFDLRISLEDITDPELAKLFDLRKRSIAAERAARRLEALTDDVDLFRRAEARKIRKRERERSKEVGALLRLKLGDRVEMCPQEQSPECDTQNHARRRGVISSMSQLVAQMLFRRNETSRPLAKRKAANCSREYVRSGLADDA